MAWLLTKSVKFSVRSLYLALNTDQVVWKHRKLWYAKIPLKEKVLMWLVFRNILLTRDNVAKRNWNGKDKSYTLCDHPETMEHLFSACVVTKFIWGFIRRAMGMHGIPYKIEDFSNWAESFSKIS